MDKLLIPPCFNYLYRNADLTEPSELLKFQKVFISTMQKKGVSVTNIATSLMLLPQSNICKNMSNSIDLSMYKGVSLLELGSFDEILDDSSTKNLSCSELIKECSVKNNICVLCELSKKYGNSTEKYERAIIGHMLSSYDSLKTLIPIIANKYDLLFKSKCDLWESKYSFFPIIINGYNYLYQAIVKKENVMFGCDSKKQILSSTVRPLLIADNVVVNEKYLDRDCKFWVGLMIEKCIAASKEISFDETIDWIKAALINNATMGNKETSLPSSPEESVSNTSDNPSFLPNSEYAMEFSFSNGLDFGKTYSDNDNSDEENPPILLRDNNLKNDIEIIASSENITKEDEVVSFTNPGFSELDKQECSILTNDVSDNANDSTYLFKGHISSKELKNNATEIKRGQGAFAFDNALIKEEIIYLECCTDDGGINFVLLYLSGENKFYYSYMNYPGVINALQDFLSNSSKLIVCYQPYLLYSLCRTLSLQLRGVFSIYSFYKSISDVAQEPSYFEVIKSLSDNFVIGGSIFDSMKKYPLIARKMLSWIDEDPANLEYMKSEECLYDTYGSNYCPSIYSNDYELFTIDSMGTLNVRSLLVAPKEKGYIVECGLKHNPEDSKKCIKTLLNNYAFIGGWRQNNYVYYIGQKNDLCVFFIKDCSPEKDVFLDYVVDQIFEMDRNNIFQITPITAVTNIYDAEKYTY